MLNNTATEAKYNATIPIDGTIGIKGDPSGMSCFTETSLRFEVVGVGLANSIDIQAKLRNSPNWYVIATIPGSVTGTIDITSWDYIRYNVTTASGSGSLYASGFFFKQIPSNQAIPEVTVDPPASTPGQTWVLRTDLVGTPIGLLLSLTHTVADYKLSYRTISGSIVRTNLA